MSKTSKKGDGTTTVHGKNGIAGNLPSDKTKAGPSAQIPILSGILERKQEEDVSKIEAQYERVLRHHPAGSKAFIKSDGPYGGSLSPSFVATEEEPDAYQVAAREEMESKIAELKSAPIETQFLRWALTNNSAIRNARLALMGSLTLDASLLTSGNSVQNGLGIALGAVIAGVLGGNLLNQKLFDGEPLYSNERDHVINPVFPQRDANGLFS